MKVRLKDVFRITAVMSRQAARGAVLCIALVLALFGMARASEPQYLHISMYSSLLSAFWSQPVHIDAHVLLPDSYYKEPQRRYPVLYWIQGFGGEGHMDANDELDWQRPMRRLHKEFIVIYLNGMFNGGHQEFADSANNGPWGSALTTEFIPKTDAYFRTIASGRDRFVAGHSSGGWSALWLQATYPDVFGGEWSISPDPVDFRDFIGPDLTRNPPQNFYHDDRGRGYMIDGARLSRFVLGPGWERRQYESFDSVFSPRGADGKPQPLFDRGTGVIDAAVEQYWVSHYDIAQILDERWPDLRDKLHGKLHIIVGTKDNFGLDAPVRLLQAELSRLGSDAEFDYVPDADHWSVLRWNGGVFGYIIREASAGLSA
jgi:pimeloyl-ACP methyl ester carboxylesterase